MEASKVCHAGIPQAFCFLFGTVYTLWSHPHLLPAFSTWPPVLHKLAGGAGKGTDLKTILHGTAHLPCCGAGSHDWACYIAVLSMLLGCKGL